MAITITVKCKDQEEMFKAREIMHNALIGSPGYINSEIAICDNDEDSTSFHLFVGETNDDNVEFKVNNDDLHIVAHDE